MCAERSADHDRFNLFSYRRLLQRAAAGAAERRLTPASLAAIAAGIFTAVGVAAWLGPDIAPGLARDSAGMWEFVRGNSSQAGHEAAPWNGSVTAASADPSAAPRRVKKIIVAKASAPAAPAIGGRAVCVRLCDGFFFPVGDVRSARDLPGQEAICHSICPGAPTHVYVEPNGSDTINAAAARDGRLYSALPVAFRHTLTADSTCTCNAPNQANLTSLMKDLTLRRGDAVATADGVRVFKGAKHWPYHSNDFLSLAEAHGFEPKATALLAIDRAIKPLLIRPSIPLLGKSMAAAAAKPAPVSSIILKDPGDRHVRTIGTDVLTGP